MFVAIISRKIYLPPDPTEWIRIIEAQMQIKLKITKNKSSKSLENNTTVVKKSLLMNLIT